MSAYTFTDTTQASPEATRPAEAVCFNGIWLDDEITGFQTLNVQGREVADRKVETYETGSNMGENFKRVYYKPRTITVTYQLKASTNTEFREYYDQLNYYLGVEQAKLIFNDESNKYFIATKASNKEVDPGLNNVISTIEFLCADPRKYSVVERNFEAELSDDGVLEVQIQNSGTEAAPVSYTVTHKHENGFIGIVSEHGAIQLGNMDEVDGVEKQRSEELFRYDSPIDFDAMTDGQGILTENFPKNGTWGSTQSGGKNYLSMATLGSGASWHGASKYQVIPQDSSGYAGAKNFYCQTRVWFEAGKPSQTGLMEFVIGDKEGNLLASIHLLKATTNGAASTAVLRVGTNEWKRISFNATGSSPVAVKAGQLYIRKTGELFEFYFGGKYSIRVPSMANKEAYSVTLFVGNQGSRQNNSNDTVTRMYFEYLFFRKDNVTYLSDVPNRYQAGDVVFIDGDARKIYTNGVPTQQDEVIGSDYFKVPPGTTTVQILVSDFCSPLPDVEARIREVFL